MNTVTRKQTVLKVVIVSAAACISWILLVKPAIQNLEDQRQTVESHKELIAEYKHSAGVSDSRELLEVHEKLQGMLDSIDGLSVQGDSGTMLHNLINESAGNNGVSVARIESVNANQLIHKIDGTTSSVEGIHNVDRVEVEGEYASVISFLHDVISGPMQVSFTSFRFIPDGVEQVRLNIEINSIMLTSIPAGSELGGGN